jgi:hypothetical protein
MKKTLRPSGGHILDIDSMEVSDRFLSRANNVHTRKGFPSRIGGRRVAYSTFGDNALHLMNFNLSSNWWLALKASSIEAIRSGASFDVSYATQQTISNPYEWSSGLLNGIPVFTNGKDPLLFWDGNGANAADVVPDWPSDTVAKAIAIFRYHIFAMNVEETAGTFENKIIWSDATEPGALPATWTPAASNEAGSTLLADTPGRCICGLPLGSQLLIYKPQSIYSVEYFGQQPDRIFDNRAIVRSVGALSTHCILEIDQKHLVVGNDDIVLTDGINTTSIAENRIKTFLSNTIDETNILNTFVVRDINRREVWVCVPEAGSQFATIAHVWDERRDTWVTRDLNNVSHATVGFVQDTEPSDVWDDDSGIWDDDLSPWTVSTIGTRAKVVSAEPAALYVEDTFDSTSVSGTIQKFDLDFGDDTQRKLTSRIWVEGSGTGIADVFVRLGARLDTDENTPISWGPYKARQAGGTPYEVEGRFISVECTATGTNPWTINRISIEAQFNGTY